MGIQRRLFLGSMAAVFLLAATTYAQDSPSLGDLARQQRQQKEKSKTTQGKDAKAAKVITNEVIGAHAATTSAPVAADGEHAASTASASASTNDVKPTAEVWTSQISAQKSQIASLQRQIGEINQSIQFAPANCVENCVQWNERQVQKQRQAEGMQAQLEVMRKHLEEMQDAARKQGYGSAVYDP
jgi:hypothetical protein